MLSCVVAVQAGEFVLFCIPLLNVHRKSQPVSCADATARRNPFQTDLLPV